MAPISARRISETEPMNGFRYPGSTKAIAYCRLVSATLDQFDGKSAACGIRPGTNSVSEPTRSGVEADRSKVRFQALS